MVETMKNDHLADIILPLAVKGKFTYLLPGEFIEKTKPGCRVIVQFGNRKFYSGIVYSVYHSNDRHESLKSVHDLIDPVPVVNEIQLKFWNWIADYYMCSPGEVMKAALPSGFCLESETLLRINQDFNDFNSLDTNSLSVISFIEKNSKVYLKNLPDKIIGRNTLRIVNELIMKNIILTGEFIEERYRPKVESFIVLSKKYSERDLNEILDKLLKAPKQYKLISAYLEMTNYKTGSDVFPVKKSLLLKQASALSTSLTVLIKKDIFTALDLEVDRLIINKTKNQTINKLSDIQLKSLSSITEQFKKNDTVLLYGITSSGKTEIYIHLIEEYLKQGKQVLYLLPEITLTTQIISRLEKYFSSVIGVYHSGFNSAEKVEIWKKVAANNPDQDFRLIIGARSSLFLPFSNLGLVIIDEEHDGSYKQQDPSPRYNARDSAIVLAGLHKAKTLLGSATPSIESYHNCIIGKFGLVELTERFGEAKLPQIKIANVREAYRKRRMVSHFTPELLNAIDTAVRNGRQVILFQNRRGFSPYIECLECGWIPECTSCAVKLTYHKGLNKLVCHYCGYKETPPLNCPKCGSSEIKTRGFGTEKIEDEVKIVFPALRVARLDYDTTRNKNSLSVILTLFENRQTDILVGTQIISKGLDFENLAVVGILNADYMLNFPDFRAWEKSFQLLEQVSGRAGRKLVEGEVIIQTSDPANPVIRMLMNHDYHTMFKTQLEERRTFGYPPFTRLVRINIRHKEWDPLKKFSDKLGLLLRESFGSRVLGPEAPVITRIHTWHIRTILIKIEKEKSVSVAKVLISKSIEQVEKMKGAGSLKISIDVDPY
jgi:primosomal protein N' (replication factor Y) (superfamily II helicase)